MNEEDEVNHSDAQKRTTFQPFGNLFKRASGIFATTKSPLEQVNQENGPSANDKKRKPKKPKRFRKQATTDSPQGAENDAVSRQVGSILPEAKRGTRKKSALASESVPVTDDGIMKILSPSMKTLSKTNSHVTETPRKTDGGERRTRAANANLASEDYEGKDQEVSDLISQTLGRKKKKGRKSSVAKAAAKRTTATDVILQKSDKQKSMIAEKSAEPKRKSRRLTFFGGSKEKKTKETKRKTQQELRKEGIKNLQGVDTALGDIEQTRMGWLNEASKNEEIDQILEPTKRTSRRLTLFGFGRKRKTKKPKRETAKPKNIEDMSNPTFSPKAPVAKPMATLEPVKEEPKKVEVRKEMEVPPPVKPKVPVETKQEKDVTPSRQIEKPVAPKKKINLNKPTEDAPPLPPKKPSILSPQAHFPPPPKHDEITEPPPIPQRSVINSPPPVKPKVETRPMNSPPPVMPKIEKSAPPLPTSPKPSLSTSRKPNQGSRTTPKKPENVEESGQNIKAQFQQTDKFRLSFWQKKGGQETVERKQNARASLNLLRNRGNLMNITTSGRFKAKSSNREQLKDIKAEFQKNDKFRASFWNRKNSATNKRKTSEPTNSPKKFDSKMQQFAGLLENTLNKKEEGKSEKELADVGKLDVDQNLFGGAEKDDSGKIDFSKYTRMHKVGLPEGPIRQAMIRDQIEDKDIDFFFDNIRTNPDALEQNQEGNQAGSTSNSGELKMIDKAGDVDYEKYKKMVKMGLPEGAIRQKMEQDELTEENMEFFLANIEHVDLIKSPDERNPKAKMLEKAGDIDYTKYIRLAKMEVPEGGLRQAMTADGLTDDNLDFFFANIDHLELLKPPHERNGSAKKAAPIARPGFLADIENKKSNGALKKNTMAATMRKSMRNIQSTMKSIANTPKEMGLYGELKKTLGRRKTKLGTNDDGF